MDKPAVHVYPSLEQLSEAAAARAAELLGALPPGRRLSLALSGGSTPRRFHHHLATTYRDAIPWERVHLFWGDERFVPPDHPDSNFAMARDSLLHAVPIPEDHLHPFPTQRSTPEEAAAEMEDHLRRFFGAAPPGFDLMVLGLGEDGHTASLFPGAAALEEASRWVRAVEAPPYASPRRRITLTLPLINRSRHIFFLTAGANKCMPLQAILEDPGAAAERYPAARVRAHTALTWFVDEASLPQG